MITLSEILAIQINSNLCKVRVPILEPAGNTVKVELWATMILPPGIHGGYEVGDVVFVSFADNSLSRPVVLGQLYRGPSNGNAIDGMGKSSDKFDKASDFSCINLTAEGEVTIPAGTKLNYASGVSHFATIQALADEVVNLRNQVASLTATINSQSSRIDELANEVDDLADEVASIDTGEKQSLLDKILG